jgi:hypothetical protein
MSADKFFWDDKSKQAHLYSAPNVSWGELQKKMLNQLSISELTAKLSKREISAREITQACLDQIARVDGKIHAFISYDEKDALAQADAADKEISSGVTHAQKPLLGIPIAIKDVLAVKNQPLNCASKILGNFISPYDATAIERNHCQFGNGHGRLDSPTGGFVWLRRIETDLRKNFALRFGRVRQFAGSNRIVHQKCF